METFQGKNGILPSEKKMLLLKGRVTDFEMKVINNDY